MRIYIAAPYTKGDVAINVNRVFKVADKLVAKGHIPYIPHWTHFWHLISPKDYSFWITYDETFIVHWAEALLRLEGESCGADNEVSLARSLGIPVYYNIEEIPNG